MKPTHGAGDEPGTTCLNPLEQLAMLYAGKWSFNMSDDKSIGWGTSHSYARLEMDGTDERLRLDIAITVSEPVRKKLLLRRALSVIAAEEKRLYALTDRQAIYELDALTKVQDAQFVKITPVP